MKIISGLGRTEGLELTVEAEQINGPEETEGKEDNSFLPKLSVKVFLVFF